MSTFTQHLNIHTITEEFKKCIGFDNEMKLLEECNLIFNLICLSKNYADWYLSNEEFSTIHWKKNLTGNWFNIKTYDTMGYQRGFISNFAKPTLQSLAPPHPLSLTGSRAIIPQRWAKGGPIFPKNFWKSPFWHKLSFFSEKLLSGQFRRVARNIFEACNFRKIKFFY